MENTETTKPLTKITAANLSNLFDAMHNARLESIAKGETKVIIYEPKQDRSRGGLHYCAKKVIDDTTGKIYDTVTEAAAAHNMKRVALSRQLNSHNSSKTNLRFFYGA